MKWMDSYRSLVGMGNQLREEFSDLPVMALSTVHPRHPLPEDQRRLLDNGSTSCRFSWAKLFIDLIRCLVAAFRDTLEILYLRFCAGFSYKNSGKSIPVVIKTWCFGGPPRGNIPDFYYGSLPSSLAKRGLDCVVLWGDERRFPSISIQKDPEGLYLPEFGLIPLWAPFWTVLTQLIAVRSISRLSRSTGDINFSKFCNVASTEILKPLTLRNTLMYYVAKSAVEKWSPKIFISLYEGQPWESVFRHGVKTANPDCLNVAYQHTILFPHSLCVREPNSITGDMSVPDVVLATGETTAEIIRVGHEAFQSTVIPFGSYRRTITQGLEVPRPELRTILVLPEGLMEESKILFDFALSAASVLPDHRFVFRCHPALGFRKILDHLREDPNQYENIELSERDSIESDFQRSSILLYRGTSAVLYGVLAGLKPYYFDFKGFLKVDPLFDLTDWRESILGVKDFSEKVQVYATISKVAAEREWEIATEFVDQYSTAVTDDAVDQFVRAVGLN